jgi:hypothetical protein
VIGNTKFIGRFQLSATGYNKYLLAIKLGGFIKDILLQRTGRFDVTKICCIKRMQSGGGDVIRGNRGGCKYTIERGDFESSLCWCEAQIVAVCGRGRTR